MDVPLVKLTVLLLGALLIAYIIWDKVVSQVAMPHYSVKKTLNDYVEIRTYPQLVLAETPFSGARASAVGPAFKRLAAFINQHDIPMTAPVLQQQIQVKTDLESWKLAFIMPENMRLDSLPKPQDQTITLRTWSVGEVAAIRFSGRLTQEAFQRHAALLRQTLAASNLDYEVGPILALYDPPWRLPFFRRNEIWFILENQHTSPQAQTA